VRAHAAVATSVDLAKDVAGVRSAGFVNAVLRRVSTRDMETWIGVAAPSRDADPLGHLVVRYSHPRWIVAALSDSLGESPGESPGDAGAGGLAETEAALAADGVRPRVTLCVVPGLADTAELVTGGGELARWSPFGAYLDGGDPAAVPAVGEGRAAVQDEASQLVALALARAGMTGPDTRWLDLCAGPGGKARLLGGLAAPGPADRGRGHRHRRGRGGRR
jgi:16S rRNA (cytosine967-C5)-methyltransferase